MSPKFSQSVETTCMPQCEKVVAAVSLVRAAISCDERSVIVLEDNLKMPIIALESQTG